MWGVMWCAVGAGCAIWGGGPNSISKHNVYIGIFALAPASLFTSNQLRPHFTGTSDSLGINPFVLGPLTRRFSVPFWWRAGCAWLLLKWITLWGSSWNVEERFPFSVRLPLQHQCLHHCPGVCLWDPGQAPSRGTKGNSSTSLQRPAQGAQEPGTNENPSFNSCWMAAKAVSPWIAKKNKLKQIIPFPTVGTARLSLGRAPPWHLEG